VGLLGLGRRRNEPFTDADLERLRPFATLAALMLRNARRLAEARESGQAKSAFLHLAAHELIAHGLLVTGACPDHVPEGSKPLIVVEICSSHFRECGLHSRAIGGIISQFRAATENRGNL